MHFFTHLNQNSKVLKHIVVFFVLLVLVLPNVNAQIFGPCNINNGAEPPAGPPLAAENTMVIDATIITPINNDFCLGDGNDPPQTIGGCGTFAFTNLPAGTANCETQVCFQPRQGCGSALGNVCIWVEDGGNWISLGEPISADGFVCVDIPNGITEYRITVCRPGMGPVNITDVSIETCCEEPTLSCPPPTQTIECGETAMGQATKMTPPGSDECPGYTIDYMETTIPGACGGTYTRTWTLLFDGVPVPGEVCIQEVTVDPAPVPAQPACLALPAISCADADAALPGDYGNISSSMGSGACIVTKTGIPSSIDKSNIACGGGGYIEITYSVTDNCGNQYPPVFCRQDVELAPVPPQPACPVLQPISCTDGDAAAPGDYQNISSTTGSGACIVTKTGVPSSIDKSNIACGGGGYIEITYTVTDNCNRSYPDVICRQDVELAPIPAQPACLALAAISCADADAALPGDYGNISSSMGSGACIVTKTGIPSSIDKSNIACGGGGYIEITYSVTDNCGNQYPPVVCRQDVEVAPVPAQPVCPDLPALTCEEADAAQPGDYGNIMSTTGTGICIITKTGIPTSIDKTGVDICGGVIIIRYSVSDNCGNQYPDVVCEQQVLPAPAPVWDLMPGDIYLACNEDPVVSSLSWTQGAGSGTCGATGQVTSKLKGLINIGVCAEGYQTEEWTYTPECGDPITHSRKVFYKFDKVKPYIYNVPKSIVIPCGSDLPPWPSNVTTGDNCPGDVSLMRRQIRGFAACGSIYWERSWIATDECGNVTIKKQNIHFSDTKAPSLTIGPDMVLECGDPIPEPDYEASDDCSTFKVTFDEDRTDYNDCEYKIVRTWTVRDACGNSVTKSQTIEVVDNTAPVITPVNPMLVDVPNGGYIEMYNCESPQVLMEDVVIDECCKIASSEAKDELITTGKCDMFGFYRRFKCSVTAVDAAGNEAEYFFYVHLIDTTAPEILNAPADLDLPCEADVPVASQDVGVKDDCMLTKTPQFEENTVYDDSDSSKYAVVRIWHSTDNCGNRGEAVQIVTVCDFDKSLLNSTIGNTVWFDANQNGLQEAEEGGINGVKVILYRVQQHYSGASATKVDSTVSATVDGIAGKYSFEVTRGSYLLQFVAPEGMSFTTKGAGVDETNSDADPATGMTDVFSIGYAEENLKLDAGLYGDPVLPDFGELETQVNVINASDITAFPNPVSERVNVSLPVTEPGEVDIKLLDQLGQEVVGQREYMSKGTHTRTLDVSQAPAGMYLLHVSMPNGVVSKMLIKQ